MPIAKQLLGQTRQVPQRGEKKTSSEQTAIYIGLIDAVNGLALQSGIFVVPSDTVATNTLAEGSVLTPTAGIHRISGVSGPVTLSATTPIANGVGDSTVSQKLHIVGVHAANFVTILASSANVVMNGNVTLADGDHITFWWDAVSVKWRERNRSH